MALIPEVRFNTYDNITNKISTVGYALELYTFRFEIIQSTIPEYISNNIFVWDFGDGNYSTEVTPVHWYKAPGKYKVSLTVYGVDENEKYVSYKNSFTQTIDIYNYVPGYSFETYGDVITKLEVENFEKNNSWVNNPIIKFNFELFNAWQSYDYTKGKYKLNLNVVDSSYPLLKIDDYNNNAYLHLSPTDKFLNLDFQPINNIEVEGTPIYVARNLNGDLIQIEYQEGATFIGLSSSGSFYYSGNPNLNAEEKDLEKTIIEISLDTTNFKEPYEINNNITTIYNDPILLTKPCRLEFYNVIGDEEDVINNVNGFITSNGIYESGFDIYKYKYINKPINFIFRYAINEENSILYPVSFINNLSCVDNILFYNGEEVGNIYLKSNNNIVSCDFNFDYVNQPDGYISDKGGYLKGTLSSQQEVKDCYIEVTLNKELIFNADFETPLIIRSSVFNIETPNKIELRKINENFKLFDKFQQVSLQPAIKNHNNLNNYLSTIFGDPSDPNSMSVKIYEKTANYIANINDIDTCNINSLYNYYNALSFNISDNNYAWPPNFRRIVDLISIPYFKLRGYYNQFNLNFNDNGYTNNLYGVNKGKLLDISTYNVSAGIPIIAKEKFSNIYSLINTDVIVNKNIDNNILSTIYPEMSVIGDTIVYPLRNYKNDTNNTLSGIGWGWNLILPSKNCELSSYYEFYEYIPNQLSSLYSNTNLVNNIIDWNNIYNNIQITDIQTLDDWEEIKKVYIMQNLYNNIIV